MRPDKRAVLLALAVIAAVGGLIVLLHGPSREPDPRAQSKQDVPPRLESPVAFDRFAYVSNLARTLLADAAVPRDAEPQTWLVEIQEEPVEALRGSFLEGESSLRLPWRAKIQPPRPKAYTLSERLAEISPAALKRLTEKFLAAKAKWPPAEVALLGIKDEKTLELYARSMGGEWQFVYRYPVLAASGLAGPKLREGDRQVPEGLYGISFLNPNSAYHVSLRVNYPNPFDRAMAAKDGRTGLGGDIMIHGKAPSAGCLSVSDDTAEELFVLAAYAGLPNVKIIIAPTDFRRGGVPTAPGGPAWLPRLYAEIADAMSPLKPPPSRSLLSFFSN
jgi:L,D-transpeptidase catalytic domain